MFHQDAFREILLNAIVHKTTVIATLFRLVYEDKIYVWNDGEMPLGLDSTDKLFMKHSSKLYNPKLAGVFFKSGMTEACNKYLQLLNDKGDLHLGQSDQDDDHDVKISF